MARLLDLPESRERIFDFAIVACLAAAAASWFLGGKYVNAGEHVRPAVESVEGEMAIATDGD